MTRELYPLHKLLFDLRHNSGSAADLLADPEDTARRYGLPVDQVDAIAKRQFGALYRLGLNPYLLYFGALEAGASRDEYYEDVRRVLSEV